MYGKRFGLFPVRHRHYGVTHWWLEDSSGQIYDFTAGQYTTPFPYHKGKRGGFLTKAPSRRTRAVIRVVRRSYNAAPLR